MARSRMPQERMARRRVGSGSWRSIAFEPGVCSRGLGAVPSLARECGSATNALGARSCRLEAEGRVIIVDNLFDGSGFYHGPNAERAREVGASNGHLWCHMTSTISFDELHDFAAR